MARYGQVDSEYAKLPGSTPVEGGWDHVAVIGYPTRYAPAEPGLRSPLPPAARQDYQAPLIEPAIHRWRWLS